MACCRLVRGESRGSDPESLEGGVECVVAVRAPRRGRMQRILGIGDSTLLPRAFIRVRGHATAKGTLRPGNGEPFRFASRWAFCLLPRGQTFALDLHTLASAASFVPGYRVRRSTRTAGAWTRAAPLSVRPAEANRERGSFAQEDLPPTALGPLFQSVPTLTSKP